MCAKIWCTNFQPSSCYKKVASLSCIVKDFIQKYVCAFVDPLPFKHFVTHSPRGGGGGGGLDTRHQRYLSSQHFYTRVALRNSETTFWSKVEDVGFHKKARKVAYYIGGWLHQLPSD